MRNEISSKHSIFTRLSTSFGFNKKLNGHQIIDVYKTFSDKKGAVWYSTDSLHRGISKNKVEQFLDLIFEGNKIKIFFAISEAGGGENELDYEAEVLDIQTDKEKRYSPDKNLTPAEWSEDKSKIWLKIKNIKPSSFKVDDFIVASTQKPLRETIKSNSRYIFGYIIKN